MKKNYFIKKPKRHLVSFMIFFCGLFANSVMAQETFTWNGSTSTAWADAANWNQSAPGVGDDYPGQTFLVDFVVVDNNSTLFAPTFTGTSQIGKLTVSNAFGTASGATLTIASGTLTVNNATVNVVTLAGGNIVNEGTLNITSTSTGASQGILLASATQVPGVATEFGYSGLGN
uniref:hypothetical protein n=1 Tax=Flavobacterium sp. TaxID=239 RepID=UPI00286B721E